MLPQPVSLRSCDAESSRDAQLRNQLVQRVAHTEHDTSEEAVDDDILEQGGSSEEGMVHSRKRQKITRARNACLPCRIRKCRCDGTRPEPCSGCVKEGLKCTWPTKDGRSAQARKDRRKGKSRSSVSSNVTFPSESDTWDWMMNADWLDTLCTTETQKNHNPSAPSGAQFHQDGEPLLQDRTSHHSLSDHPPPEKHTVSTTCNTLLGLPILQADDMTFQTGNTNQMKSIASSAWIPALDMSYSSAPFPKEGSNQNTSDLNTPLGIHGADGLPLRAQTARQVLQEPPPHDEPSAWMAHNIFSGLPTFDADDEPHQNTNISQMDTMRLPDWLSALDPSHFVSTMSSKLPTVEDGSSAVEGLPISDIASVPNGAQPTETAPGGPRYHKIVKVTWWRPHGRTAIAPGLKRIILNVRVDSPSSVGQAPAPMSAIGEPTWELIGSERMPSVSIMKHLLSIFMEHFGCQFPFLDHQALESSIESRTGSNFLFLCIAAIASRFSSHPSIAQQHLQPHEYGNDFYLAAKSMLGSMLAVPSRETAIGLVLMAHLGLGTNSEAEEWMFTGMAIRMAIDLGLHLDPPLESNISGQERRLNRLAFWSIVLLDFALSFGTGRQTTLRVEEITQPLPRIQDIHSLSDASPDAPASPFPYAVRQMLAYGHLITLLNSRRSCDEDSVKAIQLARTTAIQEYNSLPLDMQWNVTNLQRHARASQAAIYLHLHLWMHTIIASGYLTGTDYLRRGPGKMPHGSGSRSGAVTPNAVAASNLWRNSARTIGDILVLADIINPSSYMSLPFCNQAFYVAGCCYVKEIEQDLDESESRISQPPGLTMTSISSNNVRSGCTSSTGEKEAGNPHELFKALVTSVAANNISTVQQGLSKQTLYWPGIAWVAEALAQRMAGVGAGDIDLVGATDKPPSTVYGPDAGLLQTVEESLGASYHYSDSSTSLGAAFPELPPNMLLRIDELDLARSHHMGIVPEPNT